MKNSPLFLFAVIALALACGCTTPAIAQYDSSRLDIGYLHLKRDFTQTITVKGSDLEKMPFTNLSDAIAAWFSGAYTQPVTLQYVVDGNPVSDVNAYSVFDIEEVVLVRNAAALVNTADGQQELVIVRTRRGQGKGGITADVRTGLVDDKTYGFVSDLRFYHDYYLNAWRNLGKLNFGVAANYTRDVLPLYYSQDELNPENLQRWRLNGYFTWKPNSRNQIDLFLNYNPERIAGSGEDKVHPTQYSFGSGSTQHYILPRVLWHSAFSPKGTNELQASFVRSIATASNYNNQIVGMPSDSIQQEYSNESGLGKSYHLWLRDRIEYRARAKRWQIEPAIDASYEHFNDQTATWSASNTTYYIDTSQPPAPPPFTGYGYAEVFSLKGNRIVVTPALEVSYAQAVDILAGVLVEAGDEKGSGGRAAFPFASVALDPIALADGRASSGLKVFGSYAQRTYPSPQGYSLMDLESGNGIGASDYLAGTTYEQTLTGTIPIGYDFDNPSQVYWVWQTGVTYTGWKGRLTIQYSLQQRNFPKLITNSPPVGSNSSSQFALPKCRSTLQQVNIRVKVFDADNLHWLMGINVAALRNKTPVVYANPWISFGKEDIGDDAPAPPSWTGGWVNRIALKRFTAGFDLLYHFGESVQSETNSGAFDTLNVNSIITPNIYVGYSLQVWGTQKLECFVETRGLFRNSSNDLLDDRRYYTVGGKISL